MASSSAFTTEYQPTPLEQAYTLYVLDVVLQVPREPFRLSGRLAVPFLNSSGVDRNLLRQMWTVVDPSMRGFVARSASVFLTLKNGEPGSTKMAGFVAVRRPIALSAGTPANVSESRGADSQFAVGAFTRLSLPIKSYLSHRYRN